MSGSPGRCVPSVRRRAVQKLHLHGLFSPVIPVRSGRAYGTRLHSPGGSHPYYSRAGNPRQVKKERIRVRMRRFFERSYMKRGRAAFFRKKPRLPQHMIHATANINLVFRRSPAGTLDRLDLQTLDTSTGKHLFVGGAILLSS